MSYWQHITFEEKFEAFVPHETRVSNSLESERKVHEHDEAWILVKLIAYLIDITFTILVIPIAYNVYHYLKRWQTWWQQIMGIRIYRFHHHGKPTIASIPQLLLRFVSKLLFLGTWAIVWINLISVRLGSGAYSELDLAIKMSYLILMLGWIHGYTLPMWFNKHHRWLHDMRAGTVVAYDHWCQIKRIILWIILCACLYYVILVVWPHLIGFLDNYMQWSWLEMYWSIWARIDYWILHGLYAMWLAK
jgi:hypothetical protein